MSELDSYLDLARDLKNLRKMKMTMTPIIVGALGKDRAT